MASIRKQKYEKPTVEVIELASEDIICTSGGEWPGWGLGDENHDHVGPPGIGGWHPEKPGQNGRG